MLLQARYHLVQMKYAFLSLFYTTTMVNKDD